MEMRLSEVEDNAVKVTLHGRLDTTGVSGIETRFAAATARKNALVDLTEVSFLASMGIRMLISAARTLRQSGHKLVLVGPQSLVGEVLENAGLGQIVPIAADERAALQLLAQ